MGFLRLNNLLDHFQIRDLGKLKYFLSIEGANLVAISQKVYNRHPLRTMYVGLRIWLILPCILTLKSTRKKGAFGRLWLIIETCSCNN